MNSKIKTNSLKAIVLCGLVISSSAALAADESGSSSFWDKTKVTGQINTSYNYNFNNPPLGAANNTLRVFDVNANDFDFNLVEVAIETQANDWAKFRLDLNYGEDVAIVDGLKGGVIGADEFGVQQAYVELTAPVGNGLTIKAGQFTTPIGYEVIESAYNFNTSRSLLFGYAIPFSHTGITATYAFNDRWTGMLGVVNGWDSVRDINKGKSLLAQLVYKPVDTFTLSVQGTYGPEQAASDGNMRGLVDVVLNWVPTEQWTFGLNYDFGKEEGLAGAGGLANWQGAALYAHWKPYEKFGLSLRGEFMQDDGSRLAQGNDTTIGEGTLTAHVYLAEGWETRFEFRHDHADRGIFTRNGAARRFQDTLSAELVYAF